MRVIAFPQTNRRTSIEDEDVIKKTLKHLDLWDVNRKPRPTSKALPIIPDLNPMPSVDDYLIDPDYPVEAYLASSQPVEING